MNCTTPSPHLKKKTVVTSVCHQKSLLGCRTCVSDQHQVTKPQEDPSSPSAQHCPEDARHQVKSFWQHLSDCGSPLAGMSDDGSHIPLYIWGDEAQYRDSGEEILVLTLGSILDGRRYSVESCYPMCILRTETRKHS